MRPGGIDRSSCEVICRAREFAYTIRREPASTTTTAAGTWPSTSSTPMPRNSCGLNELTGPTRVCARHRRPRRRELGRGLLNSRARNLESPGAYDSVQRYQPRLEAEVTD